MNKETDEPLEGEQFRIELDFFKFIMQLVKEPLYEPFEHSLVYQGSQHVRVVIDGQHVLYDRGQGPESLLLTHVVKHAAHDEVHALAVAYLGVSLDKCGENVS